MTTTTRSDLDRKIDALKPGYSLEISRNGDVSVVAERSGDGRTLRIFRQTPKGFTIIKTTSFSNS